MALSVFPISLTTDQQAEVSVCGAHCIFPAHAIPVSHTLDSGGDETKLHQRGLGHAHL
jgi:hypothetical protein